MKPKTSREIITDRLSDLLGQPVTIERLYHNWRRHVMGDVVPSWAAVAGTRTIYCDYTMAAVSKAIKRGGRLVVKPCAFDESAEDIEVLMN